MFIPFIFYFLFCSGFGWRNRALITSIPKRMNSHANGNGNCDINRKWVYKYLDWYQWELRDQNLIQIHFHDATATYITYIYINRISALCSGVSFESFFRPNGCGDHSALAISSVGSGKMWRKNVECHREVCGGSQRYGIYDVWPGLGWISQISFLLWLLRADWIVHRH